MEIELRGGLLRVSVNNREVRTTDLRKLADRAGALPALKRGSGRLGFQSHTGTTRFRNIEIKELSGMSKSAASQPNASKSTRRRTDSRHPADAKEFGGKHYKLFSQQLTWHDAREKCRELGGHLVIVTSEEQNQFLTFLARQQGIEAAWLGATDEEVEGRWVWVDGTPMRYSNWSPIGNQPNNKQGIEHFAVLYLAHDGKWSDQPDRPADVHPGFICQWD
jgi:hypothetical protein